LLDFFVVLDGILRGRNLHGPTSGNVARARQYLKGLECGPSGDELAKFFAPEIVLEIFPGKFFPNGSRDDYLDFCRGRARQKVMTSQKYEIRNEVASGDKVALEIDWMGTLACLFKPYQKEAKCGPTSLHSSNSRTAKWFPQGNYDCYQP
jgi:hypothetical protein